MQLCDQYGAKLLARYVQHRRLQALVSETSALSHARRTSAPAQAALAVDPRQVRSLMMPIGPECLHVSCVHCRKNTATESAAGHWGPCIGPDIGLQAKWICSVGILGGEAFPG